MARYVPYAFCLLGGILYALGFPSVIAKSLYITPIIGTGILFNYLLNLSSLKRKVLLLLAFNVGFNYTGFYWIAATLQEFGDLPFAIAFLLSSLFTLIITPHLWIFLLIIHFGLHRYEVHKLYNKSPATFGFLLAMILTALEYYTPQQFPVMIGQSWVELGSLLGYASIGGIPIYSFFSYLLIFEMLHIFRLKQTSKVHLGLIILFIISNPFAKPKNPAKKKKTINIRLVQANISNFLKIDSEKGIYASVDQVLKVYHQLSYAPSEKPLDLIIWPETAYPYAINTNQENRERTILPNIFVELALKKNADLFIGGYDHFGKDDASYYQTEYNSNFHIDPDGKIKDIYHKHILIPFGETLPFGPLNRWLSQYVHNISYFSEGKSFPLFETKTGHKFINTICYEGLRPKFVREYLNSVPERPHAMINLTNDSWYGDTAEPEQHLFLTKWRALEYDLPIIRSTNTGITSVIYADGTESKRMKVNQQGNLDIELNLGVRYPTLFQEFGILIILPLWVILFIFHSLLLKLTNHEN